MSDYTYLGSELELFARARHWKSYWASRLRRVIRGAVLEVGAGTGANSVILADGKQSRWVCLEPDAKLAAIIEAHETDSCAGQLEVRCGTIGALAASEAFDTILYIDVLEHIEDDMAELERAGNHLTPGGRLIVLSPAHGWLYSRFDEAIGHFRRYTARTLTALTPAGLKVITTFYFDSAGLAASAANRFILRQALPNARQIHCWDTWMVPCSRILDPLSAYCFGKSVICVWERT